MNPRLNIYADEIARHNAATSADVEETIARIESLPLEAQTAELEDLVRRKRQSQGLDQAADPRRLFT